MTTVPIKGLDDLGRALKEFPEVIGKKYLRRGTYQAARTIADDAVIRAAGAPLYAQAMEQISKNIAVFARRNPDPSTAHYAVGVRRVKLSKRLKRVLRVLRNTGQAGQLENDTFFWHWYEFGTTERRTTKGENRGKIIAQPYLRPAFEAKKNEAIEAFKKSLAQDVEAAAREVRR